MGSNKRFHVAVCGAAGGIGQPLSLLLALNKDVKILNLYDVVPIVEGVAKDISHVDTDCIVTGFAGSVQDKAISEAALKKALTGMDIVVIPAGVPRKPGMTRDDLFSVNAGIVRDLVLAIAQSCPKAFICIISNPVNSTVPIAAEVLKQKGVFDPKRLFGVSTLDVVRANKFVGEIINKDPSTVSVPVVGGHSGVSILPLLSQATPKLNLPQDAIEKLTFRIQNAGTEVVEAKKGGGSATLSMAYAGARFAGSLMKALKGDHDVVECTYIYDAAAKEYFAWPIKLGTQGIDKILKTEKLSAYEKKLMEKDVKQDVANGVKAGVDFVTNSKL